METILTDTIFDELEQLKSIILENFTYSLPLEALKKQLKSKQTISTVAGLNSTSKAIITAYLTGSITGPSLIITPTVSSALKLQMELGWLTVLPVYYFPSVETNPYELAYSPANTVKERLECIDKILKQEPSIIIINAKSLLSKLLSPEEYENYSLSLQTGEELEPTDIIEKLTGLGYTRTPMVIDPGEFSIRGDICDIYPISGQPIRIEFAFDEIDTIRFINIETQRSISNTDKVKIRPRYKIVINNDNQKILHSILAEKLTAIKKDDSIPEKEVLIENIENFITQLEEFKYFEGIEYCAPFIHKNMSTLLDYLPECATLILDEPDEIENNLFKHGFSLEDYYNKELKGQRLFKLNENLHKSTSKLLEQMNQFPQLYLKTIPDGEEETENYLELDYKYIPSFLGNLKKAAEFINNLIKEKYRVVITTEYPQRVKSVFSEWDCQAIYLAAENDEKISETDVIISRTGISTGFILPEFKLACLTDTELFGKRLKKATISKKTSKRENLDFFLSPSDLQENDFVVHARHGIGKFIKLQQMTIDKQSRDYLTIEYHKGDKLYVPVDQINLLTRYRGAGDAPPKLSKMGGADWENIKRKAQKSIEDIAADLLNLYATRARTEGYIFDPDSAWQQEMEEAFEFVETPDQLRAIIDVKNDMESEKPMDRLVCGDVGYGKTEVALRAIFKAVLSSKQVAILVPTTVLAQQHFNTLSERFLPYPINIAMLSRFRTAKEQKDTVKRLITGECDIVVGTHRLLQKDIDFKNLGLVVIDEEHRFGVKHKEKLKQLRQQIDVISMSATPIPRTLYMAMSGIRDMSLINTPPVNRKPIKTHVGAFSDKLVKSAIMREMERDGQIYYVHNRVQSIHRVAYDISQLVPDARIIVGHGQMKEKELESIMLDFSVHNYDILLCTTIIESGLDIPNVNTIIIEDADCMGLAQLYQLRGRVGRSDRQAYAFCLHKPKKILSPEAKKRLMAIREFNTLGSGYQIALRDLEIRGIGNLLGSQQHGHMVAIGFDLYCEMLDDSIKRLKGQEVVKKYLPVVDINITAFIPDNWVGTKEQKIVEYKRLAAVESQRELEIITEEWQDRFGNIPQEVENLIKIVKIRLLASEIGFNLIREEEEYIRIFTNYDYKFWQNFITKIPPQFNNRSRWVKMPETSLDGTSAILIKYSGLTPQRLINFLLELSYYLNNYLKDNKGD
jgi:transcription-repair coupling factor (superfamily II helicase)